MNIEPQELRREILLQLYTARPVPITTMTLYRMIHRAVQGTLVTQTAVERELDFLKSGGLVESDYSVCGRQTWKTTYAGNTEYERGRA